LLTAWKALHAYALVGSDDPTDARKPSHVDVLVTYALVLFAISWTIMSNHNEVSSYISLALSSGLSFFVVEGVKQESALISEYCVHLRFKEEKRWPWVVEVRLVSPHRVMLTKRKQVAQRVVFFITVMFATVGVLAGEETQCTTSEFSTSGFLCLEASEVSIIADRYTVCVRNTNSTSSYIWYPSKGTDLVSYFLDNPMEGNAFYTTYRPGYEVQFLSGTTTEGVYCSCLLDTFLYSTTNFEVTIDATYSRQGKGHFFAQETTVHLSMTRYDNGKALRNMW
jgi:hypothetical protein